MNTDSTPQLAVAIVGAGTWARVHAAAINSTRLGHIALLVGRDPVPTARMAVELGVAAHTTDVSEAFGRADIDVIHVCTPNASHSRYVQAAVAAGKHVVVEKPLALRASEALAAAAAAQAKGCHGMTVFTYRGLPSMARAREAIQGGDLGDVRIVGGRYLQEWLLGSTPGWRMDPDIAGLAPVLADIGVHWFDALEFVSGRRVAAVYGDLEHQGPEPGSSPDTASVLVRLDNGAMGSVLLSQVYPGHANTLMLELAGDKASIRWDRDRSAPSVRPPGGDRRVDVMDDHGPLETAESALTTLFDRFYDAVASGRPPPDRGSSADYPTLWDGQRASLIVDAVVESARQNRWVSVPDDMADARQFAPRVTSKGRPR